MNPERWTQLTNGVVVASAVTLCLYDVAARVYGGNNATISVVLADASRRWPVIAVAAGALMGHWFWPVR